MYGFAHGIKNGTQVLGCIPSTKDSDMNEQIKNIGMEILGIPLACGIKMLAEVE